MTQKTRRILFLISLALFLIASPILVEYARGLRFDFKSWQFVETGGLFFRIHSPTEVNIFLDDELTKTTGSFSFFNSVFIQNLIPKDYEVKISKNGFQEWVKTLKVESELVTEAHNVVLLPNEIKLSPISDVTDKINNLHASFDGKMIAFTGYDAASSKTFVRLKNLSSDKESSYVVSKNKLDIELGDWQINDGRIIFGAKDKSDYVIIDSINDQVRLLSQNLPKQFALKNISAVILAPQNATFLLKENALYDLNLEKKSLKIILKNIVAIRAFNNEAYFVSFDDKDDKYILNRAYYRNGELGQQQVLGELNFKISKSPNFDIGIINSELTYIHEINDGLLVEYSAKDGMRRLDSEISAFSLSSDQKKVLYQKKNEIWVYYRDDIKIQPFKYIGQRELVVKIPQEIISSQWYTATDNHIIYGFGNSIKFIELDERDNRNIMHISESQSPQVIYSDISEKLYVLSNGILYSATLE